MTRRAHLAVSAAAALLLSSAAAVVAPSVRLITTGGTIANAAGGRVVGGRVYELAPEFFTFCHHGFWILLSELDVGRERGVRFLAVRRN